MNISTIQILLFAFVLFGIACVVTASFGLHDAAVGSGALAAGAILGAGAAGVND